MKGSLLQAACGMEIFMNSIIGNKKARSAVEQTAEIIFTICAFFAVLAVISITVYMFLNGTPALTKVGLTEILFSTVWKPTAADPSYGILYVILTSIVGTTLAILLGVPIGVLIAVVRSSADKLDRPPLVVKILNVICKLYLTVIRGTPAMIQLLIMYYIVFGSVDVSKRLVAILTFGINSGAYVAEIIRSGIMSVDQGQFEAGRSLGLTYVQTMWYIIIPQAFKNVLPALGNEFITLLKETSICGYIALTDVTHGANTVRSQTYEPYMPLFAAALIYLVSVSVLSALISRLERRMRVNER